MKHFFIWVLVSGLFAQAAVAQSGKLKWDTDMRVASMQSLQTGKPVFAYFEGSDWCGWCKKLNTLVFSQPGFATWVQQNVILLQVDFPQTIQLPPVLQYQNDLLESAFAVKGYPTVWIFKPLSIDQDTKETKLQPLGYCSYPKEATGKEYSAFITSANKVLANKSGSGYDVKSYTNPLYNQWKWLMGTWECKTVGNNFRMQVSFNDELNRYEGILVKQGNVGFSVGEQCWTATYSDNPLTIAPAQLAIRQKWRMGSNGTSSSSEWRNDMMYLHKCYSTEINTKSGMGFQKIESE